MGVIADDRSANPLSPPEGLWQLEPVLADGTITARDYSRFALDRADEMLAQLYRGGLGATARGVRDDARRHTRALHRQSSRRGHGPS